MTDNTSFPYFAYGSNMLTERLTARCPGARPIGAFSAAGYSVSYCLKSGDGSAKAGLLPADGETAWGVVFEIPMAEQPILDAYEGAPKVYTREEVKVTGKDGAPLTALTYIPHDSYRIDPDKPYDWYQALCLSGIRQHGLPESARTALTGPVADIDPEFAALAHEGREIAVDALKAAGFTIASAVAG